MLAFFDTSIHIDLLRGTRPLADVLQAIGWSEGFTTRDLIEAKALLAEVGR